MVYRRTHQVVKRLAARRSAILAAARDAADYGARKITRYVHADDSDVSGGIIAICLPVGGNATKLIEDQSFCETTTEYGH